MRILIISPTPRAGTPQYCHALAGAIAARGHDVTVLTSLGYEFAGRARAYRVLEVFDRFRPRPVRIARLLWRLLTERPDIVHFIGAQHPGIYLRLSGLLRRATRAPQVFSPLDVYSNRNAPGERAVFTRLYARMAHVFANTRRQAGMVGELFAYPDDRVTVQPIPDLTGAARDAVPEPPPEVAPGDRLILCFGLIEERKGIPVLVEAFERVAEQVPSARLAIVGPAHMDVSGLRDRIGALTARARVTLRPDYASFEAMAGYFRAARVVVLPYVSGWTSGALAAAFGFGRPVVGTTVDAIAEVVRDGENGLLVPPGDAGALAGALVRVLTDDALADRLAEGGAATSRATSWEEKAAETEAVYLRVLGRAPEPAG